MASVALSDGVVRKLEPPPKGNRITWDKKTKRYGVRVTAAGAKSFVIGYGRGRVSTIGDFPTWSTAAARKEAERLRRDIDRGRDPIADREAERAAKVTVAELCDRYLAEHAQSKKKASSAEEDARNVRLHVLPRLGKLAAAAVERSHIAKLHHDMRGSPIGANRTLALLSKMFNLAERWGLRPNNSNPCKHVDRYPEKRRDRLITADELSRLGDALAEYKGYWAGPAAIRLLALTGMRKGEALSLRWDYVDFDLGLVRLPDSKTGAKVVPLGAPALALLAELPRVKDNPFVFPAARPRHAGRSGEPQHFVQVQDAWEAARKAAGLSDLHLHDLRHGFASIGAIGGDSLYVLGKLLGHTDSKTTQRYAHLTTDPLRSVADKISGQVAAMMGGNKSADVVNLRGGSRE